MSAAPICVIVGGDVDNLAAFADGGTRFRYRIP
jgi:hypothetical protein